LVYFDKIHKYKKEVEEVNEDESTEEEDMTVSSDDEPDWMEEDED
jgi:hypothetical protein